MERLGSVFSSSRVSEVAALSVRLHTCAGNVHPHSREKFYVVIRGGPAARVSEFGCVFNLTYFLPLTFLPVTLQVPLPPGRPSWLCPYTAQCLTSLLIRLWGYALDLPNF